ncbi:MAG: acyl-CoA thioester hydrolase/BAAT C-terminal domain-containing protein [Ignavibacteriaceae bacterium]
MSKDFILYTSKNDKLRISAFGDINNVNSPCLICIHGFKGFKDWGFWPYTAGYFAEKGFFVLTFNFSHNGIGENLTDFSEIDKFAENTLSLEVEELSELFSAYTENFFNHKGNKKVGLLGHSRGGGVALLSALNIKPDAVALWASISKPDRYTERQKNEWKKNGVFEVLNTRTNQVMRLNLSVLEDIEQNKNGSLNIKNAVENLNCPLFIAHGEQDLTVPVSEAEQLYQWSDKDKTTLYKIPAAGHTFDVVHPFPGSNLKFEKLLKQTEQFFKTNLF